MFTVMIVFSSSVVCIFHGQLKSSTTNNSWVGYCHHCTADVSLCRLQHSGKEKLLLCNNEGGEGGNLICRRVLMSKMRTETGAKLKSFKIWCGIHIDKVLPFLIKYWIKHEARGVQNLEESVSVSVSIFLLAVFRPLSGVLLLIRKVLEC